MIRDVKTDTTEIKVDAAAIKQDTTQILAEIARLQAQLPQDTQKVGSSGFMLQRYLDELTSYAETVVEATIDSNELVAEEDSDRVEFSNDERSKYELEEGIHKDSSMKFQYYQTRNRTEQERLPLPDQVAASEKVKDESPQDNGAPKTISQRETILNYDPDDEEANGRLFPHSSSNFQPNLTIDSVTAASMATNRMMGLFNASSSAQSSGNIGPKRDDHVDVLRSSNTPAQNTMKGMPTDITQTAGQIRVQRLPRPVFGTHLQEAVDASRPIGVHVPLPSPIRGMGMTSMMSDEMLVSSSDHSPELLDAALPPDANCTPVTDVFGIDQPSQASHFSGTVDPSLLAQDERVQREGEEQAGQSQSQSARADDDESSEEKTIEAGLARNEAFVAKLAGNPDARGDVGSARDSEYGQPAEAQARRLRLIGEPQRAIIEASQATNAVLLRRIPQDQPKSILMNRLRRVLKATTLTYPNEADTKSSQNPPLEPIFLKGLFRASTTSREPLSSIRAEIIRVCNLLSIRYVQMKGGFRCRTIFDPLLVFEMLVIKVPFMNLHGIQFKRLEGYGSDYKGLVQVILKILRINGEAGPSETERSMRHGSAWTDLV